VLYLRIQISYREESLNHTISFSLLNSRWFLLWVAIFIVRGTVTAQQAPSEPTDRTLAQSIEELRQQVQELRATVAEMKSEASEYRTQGQQLRQELEKLRGNAAAPGPVTTATEGSAPSASVEQRLANVEENTQVLASEVRTQYQTKVESASKYRVRFSGLVLMNLFRNSGFVDNQDFPTYAASSSDYGQRETLGATMRQSELGLEVFGPDIIGAKTRGQIQVDFGGGFPTDALNGVNHGLVRLRTASMRLDWDKTSIIAGQDNLFISPIAPTSFASLVVPSFGYSGNLWAWTPQVRIEHRLSLSADQMLSLQAGILDNVTGEPSAVNSRLPLAGESTAQPAYAARTGWTRTINGKPLTLGASGYFSKQHWGPDWDVSGWAVVSDWRVPLSSRLELSGELYRGLAVGGIGGAIGQSVLFSNNPRSSGPNFRPLNSAGGWSQLKVTATPKLEFNAVFGMDSPFSTDIHALSLPVSYYPQLLTSNRSEMANFIFRPRSDLLVSAEYRNLRTSQIGGLNTAGQVNVVMGVLF
jgi:hypothetical protein